VCLVPESWIAEGVSLEGRVASGQEFTVFSIGGREFSVYARGDVRSGADLGQPLGKSHAETWDTAKIFGVSSRQIDLRTINGD
jgi:hypothetical protein